MTSPLGELSVQAFLSDYWQKQACLIRQAFPDFQAELTADDVAGLACEELAESRLISGSYPEHNWSVRTGPFTERTLRRLPESNWTLLVQDVDKHYPPLQPLLAQFGFLPGWRMDDLMISVAAPGGSVGPHFDQYDVFLLQAAGRRRWQIASNFDPTLLENCELKVLRSFTAEQEWELEPGDMLYLPPGVAHHGVALNEGMTWSIGLRAPSQADLLMALGEWLAEHAAEGERYRDGELNAGQRAGEIDAPALSRLRELMMKPLDSHNALNGFLAEFISRFRLAHQPAPPDSTMDEATLAKSLLQGADLQRNPWTRLAWIEWNGEARLFAAGTEYRCHPALAESLCSTPLVLAAEFRRDSSSHAVLCALVNDGHLFLARP